MTSLAGSPVYEARDSSGAGWRGAIVGPDDKGTAWLVYVDVHDRFHSSGPAAVENLARKGSLRPSELDRRLRDHDLDSEALSKDKAEVLEAVLEALIASAASNQPERVVSTGRFASVDMSIEVHTPVNPEWDPNTAADELGEVVVRFCLHAVDQKHRDELLRTCVPFLQPDKTMWEAIFRKDLRVQVLLTRAGLMQLLATERPYEPVNNSCPPEPHVLHYTAKKSLVQAYVAGLAVRAVCGQWWVPVGDDTTHSSLPICPNCESGAPFAQAARDILARNRRP